MTENENIPPSSPPLQISEVNVKKGLKSFHFRSGAYGPK